MAHPQVLCNGTGTFGTQEFLKACYRALNVKFWEFWEGTGEEIPGCVFQVTIKVATQQTRHATGKCADVGSSYHPRNQVKPLPEVGCAASGTQRGHSAGPRLRLGHT